MIGREQEIAEVVKLALERERAEWPAFLDEACAGDPEMRAEVDSFLRFQDVASEFIEQGALHVAAETLARSPASPFPHQVGEYEILSRIGVGGMGEVYLAHDTKLKRRVALKLVRAGMDTAEIVSRFRHEEQILASLNHPNIAQLYGAGVAAQDIPFFAMEYIEGWPIDEYCNAQALSVAARLGLFRKVCAAVHYAHQRLVIHRDLKPSNILVTAEGEPKLLDFGIAKLIEGQDSLTQIQTLPGAMTPDYASPEQVRGEAMTTSSDVYSLGVLLYEILTGQRPYRLKNRSAAEIAHAITDQEPEPPSTVTATIDHPQSSIPPPRSMRGDLDNIVLMAMRKEPTRRYASVAQFSEDVRRHLEGLPVIARKDTRAYRTGKFLRRNKLGATAAAVVFLTLLAGIVATFSQAKIATAERDRARKQAAKAERVTAFLQNVLGFSDPSWASSNPNRKRDATISEALVEAARRAEKELADEPEALAAVHFTIGNTYRTQSRYPEAEPHLRTALDIRRRSLGPDHPETGQSMVAMAEWLLVTGRYPEAEALYREAMPIFRHAGDSKWLAITLNDLGTLKWFAGEPAVAEELLREALRVSDSLAGEDRAPRAIMFNTLGLARRDQGDFGQAAEFLQKAIDEHRALSGEPRSELALALSNLASIISLQGDDARAESLSLEAYDLFRKTVGENHQYTAYPLVTLADIYYRRENYSKAREAIEHAVQIQQHALPAEHLDLVRSRITVGKIIMRTGDLAEAESILRPAFDRLVASFPAGHSNTAGAAGALGECLTLQQRFAEAETLLLRSYDGLLKVVGPRDPRTREAARRLLRLYEAWDKPENAAPYRALLAADTGEGR